MLKSRNRKSAERFTGMGRVGSFTFEQSIPSNRDYFCSISVRESMSRCWNTECWRSRSSHDNFSSVTRKEVLYDSKRPADSSNRRCNNFHTLEKLIVCAFSVEVSATFADTDLMASILHIPFRTAFSKFLVNPICQCCHLFIFMLLPEKSIHHKWSWATTTM